jgi:hypothetical protein
VVAEPPPWPKGLAEPPPPVKEKKNVKKNSGVRSGEEEVVESVEKNTFGRS